MAEVYVNNWNEFIAAIAVSGDTVILPEEAEWDMNEILPYGLQANVTLACSRIDGRGTRIKNLNLNSYYFMYSGQDIKYFRNCLFTDWIGSDVFFFLRYGSDWFCCAISGITSGSALIDNSNSYNYSTAVMTSCSINIESSHTAFIICNFTCQYYYCRLEVHAPNSTNKHPVSNAKFCECIFYIPNATGTFYSYYFYGCTLRGNLHGVTGDDRPYGGWAGHPCVYQTGTFNENFVTYYPDKFIECTESQLKDAAYLRSKGFPIIVNGGV